MELGLGTARFGQRYGIARTVERVARAEVEAILESAAAAGVAVLDTAPAYGDVESRLGRTLPRRHRFRIVTKTPVFRRALDRTAHREVLEAFRGSLRRLGQARVWGLLVHDAEDLLADGGGAIFDALTELRERGETTRIGVSVYDGSQIDRVLARFPVDLVQAPVSLLDQRLVRSGHLKKMKEHGIEIHLRSVFLQGLVLMDPGQLPGRFEPLRARLAASRERLARRGHSMLRSALGFVRGLGADVALVGVESLDQLHEILGAIAAPRIEEEWDRHAIDDPRFVDPRRWEATS